MAIFSVDSEAVLTATAATQSTIDRLETESAALMAQLTQLHASWTGAAATTFQGAADQWRVTQQQVADALGSISAALRTAAQHYADAEQATVALFR